MTDFHSAIYNLAGQDVFVTCEPNVLDFTAKHSGKLIISTKEATIEIPLNLSDQKLKETLATVQCFLGGKSSIIISWNWKNFLTFVKGKTGKDFRVEGQLFELSFLESYIGIQSAKPLNFFEAKIRLGNLVKNSEWSNIHKIYQSVYLPLIFTLPHLETCGLSHKTKRIKVYSHYEIDGQINGRMKCANLFQHSFNPHGLTIEEKDNLRIPTWGSKFISFDYKHHEVSVLQWLTKDDYLKEILDSGRDFYEAIWEALVPVPCNEHHRKTCKEFFLPVIYGLGAESLSKKINWPLQQSKNLIEKIYSTFPAAMHWIKSQQTKMIDGYVRDHFGRHRYFENSYLIRNFVIQSPAALICLHKLNLLHVATEKIAQLCMTVHDGYVFIANSNNIEKTAITIKKLLETEDELYSGLKLKTVCSVGATLNELVNLNLEANAEYL